MGNDINEAFLLSFLQLKVGANHPVLQASCGGDVFEGQQFGLAQSSRIGQQSSRQQSNMANSDANPTALGQNFLVLQ